MLDWMWLECYEDRLIDSPPSAAGQLVGQAVLQLFSSLKRSVTGLLSVPATPTFTPEERARLTHLRERLKALEPLDPEVEVDLDPRRLEFARWLVHHGKLCENMEPVQMGGEPLAGEPDR